MINPGGGPGPTPLVPWLHTLKLKFYIHLLRLKTNEGASRLKSCT